MDTTAHRVEPNVRESCAGSHSQSCTTSGMQDAKVVCEVLCLQAGLRKWCMTTTTKYIRPGFWLHMHIVLMSDLYRMLPCRTQMGALAWWR